MKQACRILTVDGPYISPARAYPCPGQRLGLPHSREAFLIALVRNSYSILEPARKSKPRMAPRLHNHPKQVTGQSDPSHRVALLPCVVSPLSCSTPTVTLWIKPPMGRSINMFASTTYSEGESTMPFSFLLPELRQGPAQQLGGARLGNHVLGQRAQIASPGSTRCQPSRRNFRNRRTATASEIISRSLAR